MAYRLRRYDHITDALATLHWLRLPERVDFKDGCHGFSRAARRGGFRHVQHVRPNRGPNKKGPPQEDMGRN